MPSEQATELKELLKPLVHNLVASGGASAIIGLPDYEIHPRDFLLYAEEELSDLKSNKSIINCVSNLKRAIDSQIDIFLYALNLFKFYKNKRLGIDRKLGFIEKCGFFNKRSLSRINSIRNKLEHEYKLPAIPDIEVYFDLAHAFITVLEQSMLVGGSELEFDIGEWVDEEEDPKLVGKLNSKYYQEEIKHVISIEKPDVKKEFVANSEDLDELAFFIKVHSLLQNINSTYHGQYANTQLEKL